LRPKAGTGRREVDDRGRRGIAIRRSRDRDRDRDTGTQINTELACMWRADLLLFYELCA
jgi:hypothetical protein